MCDTARAAEGKSESASIITIAKENVPTWKDVDPGRIEIKEVSGLSGNKTFKVSMSEASADIVPAAIAFHERSEIGKPLLEERTHAAGRVFSKVGIGPRNIAESEGKWCIDEWAGEALCGKFMGPGCESEAMGVAAIEKMMIWSHPGEFRECVGQLLGRIHRMPTDWADPFVARYPFFLHAKFPTNGSLGTKALHSQSLEGEASLMLERWGQAIDILNASHALARRVVTVHSDFHGANILLMHSQGADAESAEPRVCAIDLELTNVGPAEFDLGYAFIVNKSLLSNAANKRAFVKGYVEAVTAGSSERGSPQDVENLLVDCEMATVKAWPPSEFIGVPDSADVDKYEALVKRLAEFCRRARVPADPLKEAEAAAVREELLEKGAYALIAEWHRS
eukprot:Hpha_TRINITY_DN15620_c2_g2::TRINITY_DN15620_c2_g2_i1::g.100692::m.100692